jgi:hypothetical protein
MLTAFVRPTRITTLARRRFQKIIPEGNSLRPHRSCQMTLAAFEYSSDGVSKTSAVSPARRITLPDERVHSCDVRKCLSRRNVHRCARKTFVTQLLTFNRIIPPKFERLLDVDYRKNNTNGFPKRKF